MSERAHPDDPGFRHKIKFHWRRHFIPWVTFVRNPYRDEFFFRYKWVNKYCTDLNVLDIPCGMGWGTSLLEGCKSIIGVDIDQHAIDEAIRRYGHKINFHVGSMENLEFPDSFFDIVVCLEGIEHVSPEIGKQFIHESFRVLKPGGMLFLSSPHSLVGTHSGNPYHVVEYQPDDLLFMLEDYYDVVENFNRIVNPLKISYFRCVVRKK